MTWPIGYLLLARGKSRLYFLTEITTNAVYVGITAWILIVGDWGIDGVGVAFFLMYLYYLVVTTLVAHHLIEFRWSRENGLLLFVFTIGTIIILSSTFLLSPISSIVLGLLVSIIIGFFVIRRLVNLVGIGIFQAYWQRLFQRR